MNPRKVSRSEVRLLTDLPIVGKAIARDLALIGITGPEQLADRCPLEMYRDLCQATDTLQDPCVIDVFISITSFMSGGEPLFWWHFSEERRRLLAQSNKRLHSVQAGGSR